MRLTSDARETSGVSSGGQISRPSSAKGGIFARERIRPSVFLPVLFVRHRSLTGLCGCPYNSAAQRAMRLSSGCRITRHAGFYL